MELLSVASISNSNIQNAIKLLHLSKSDGRDGVPTFVIKNSDIFAPFSDLILVLPYLRIVFITCGSRLLF
jgi:hypothetical protein